MKKKLFLYAILLVCLAMCKKTPPVTTEIISEPVNTIVEDKVLIDIDDSLSVELNTKNKPDIEDSNNNKFIGYSNLPGISAEYHVKQLYVYEKYIVLNELLFNEETKLWHDDIVCVYEYNKDLKIKDYPTAGKKLYELPDGPYYFKGINDDLLFIDEGTDPVSRNVIIFDLANNEEILKSAYYKSLSIRDNIVRGLVMYGYDEEDSDDIKTKYDELKQYAYKPEDEYESSMYFVVKCSYNVLTKKFILISGEYITVQ